MKELSNSFQIWQEAPQQCCVATMYLPNLKGIRALWAHISGRRSFEGSNGMMDVFVNAEMVHPVVYMAVWILLMLHHSSWFALCVPCLSMCNIHNFLMEVFNTSGEFPEYKNLHYCHLFSQLIAAIVFAFEFDWNGNMNIATSLKTKPKQ